MSMEISLEEKEYAEYGNLEKGLVLVSEYWDEFRGEKSEEEYEILWKPISRIKFYSDSNTCICHTFIVWQDPETGEEGTGIIIRSVTTLDPVHPADEEITEKLVLYDSDGEQVDARQYLVSSKHFKVWEKYGSVQQYYRDYDDY